MSLIQSNFYGIGSGLPVPAGGFYLHDRGRGFTLTPGHPNELRPGRRPLHTLSPTIWTRGSDLAAVIGTRGGHIQPQLVSQLSAWLMGWELEPAQAMAMPRWMVPWPLGDGTSVVELEPGTPPKIVEDLRARGHAVTVNEIPQGGWGPMSAIRIQESGLRRGAADPRVDAEACRRVGVGSMIVVPLRRAGSTIGVLNVLSARPDRFSDDDRSTLELIAAPFGTAMSNAWQLQATSEQALTDPLTNLANRTYALHELDRVLHRQIRRGGHTAVVFIDLDGFKQVNDRHGHAAGDETLVTVSTKLREAVRTTDTPARFGGDEFVIICEGLVDPADAQLLADRLCDSLPGTYPVHNGSVLVGASIGIAVADRPVAAHRLLRAADEAMYEAKQAGGNRHTTRHLH